VYHLLVFGRNDVSVDCSLNSNPPCLWVYDVFRCRTFVTFKTKSLSATEAVPLIMLFEWSNCLHELLFIISSSVLALHASLLFTLEMEGNVDDCEQLLGS